jgi:hypothetical protein
MSGAVQILVKSVVGMLVEVEVVGEKGLCVKQHNIYIYMLREETRT